jgi:hypothetical protein
LAFSTAGGGGAAAPTERMRIDSSGNVGIGTTAPGTKLDVVGNIRTRGSASPTVTFNNGTIENTLSISSSAFQLSVPSANPITFLTTNTERVRIDSSGFVGIGQTTPISYLDIYGNGAYTYSRYWRSDQAGYGARFGTGDTLYGSAPARSAGVDGFSAVVLALLAQSQCV